MPPDTRIWDADPALRAEAEAEAEVERHRGAVQIEVADARPPEYSDEALALGFSAKHGADLQYVAIWGRWIEWCQSHWHPDQTLRAFDLARAHCRVSAAAVPGSKKKIASAIASAKTVASVERLAKADRRHAAAPEMWDADPWLLTTKGD